MFKHLILASNARELRSFLAHCFLVVQFEKKQKQKQKVANQSTPCTTRETEQCQR